MPKRSNEFQRLIYRAECALADSGFTVVESQELKDKITNHSREIDVFIEGISIEDGRTCRIAVECRDHKRKQDVTWVEQLIAKYQDLEVDKVIAVSKNGFTKQAHIKAAHYLISTLSLDDALELDWTSELAQGAAYRINLSGADLEYVHLYPFFSKLESISQNCLVVNQMALHSTVLSQDGKSIGNLAHFLNRIYNKNLMRELVVELNKEYEHEIALNGEIRKEVVRELADEMPYNLLANSGFEFEFRAIHFGIKLKSSTYYFPLKMKSYRNALIASGECDGSNLEAIQTQNYRVNIKGIVEMVIKEMTVDSSIGLPVDLVDFESLLDNDGSDI